MKTWISVPLVVLNTWSGHTLTGGNGRGDGSATSVRIDVILAAGEAGLCRTSSQNLNRVAMIAVPTVNGATAHGGAKRSCSLFPPQPRCEIIRERLHRS